MARLDPFLATYGNSFLTFLSVIDVIYGLLAHDMQFTGYSQVAELISSSCDAGNLYSLLVRMSLSDDQLPSMATRHAISAISYQHLRLKNEALAHHTTAIHALQASIEDFDPSRAMQMMATSMLLSIFEVRGSPSTLTTYY